MPSNLGLNAAHGAISWAQFVLEHLGAQSMLLRSGARRINVVGAQAHVPRVLTSGTATFVAELAEIPSNAPTGDDLVLQPAKLANTVVLSAEALADSPVNELEGVGNALVRAIAVALDARAFSASARTAVAFAGLLSNTLPTQAGGVSIDNILRAIGTIAAAGGVADAVYINPGDLTTLRLAKDTSGRPLLQPDLQVGGAERIGGAILYPVPALPSGTALVAQADQIVVGVRQDADVSLSAHARFTSDAVVARVVARADVGINDVNGLVKVVTP